VAFVSLWFSSLLEILSVTLCNGSIHLELADLTLSQRILRNQRLGPVFAKLANRRIFKAQMRRIFGPSQSVNNSELDLLWEGIIYQNGHKLLSKISAYLDERTRYRHRWIDPLTRLDLPTHILWGRRDPVAVAAIAERLAAEIPQARLTWLDELGHYPMLESPEQWAEAAISFLRAV
jgi:pimeloyl-ACP methyl ester carboxylesterase